MKLTNEQLSALPEFTSFDDEILPNGVTIRHRRDFKFSVYKPNPEDVLLFTDSAGSWYVDYHIEGGPYKRRAYL